MNMEDDEEFIPITVQEEKELKRVFDHLCNFGAKSAMNKELLDLKKQLSAKNLSSAANTSIEARIDAISKDLATLDTNPNLRKITVNDVQEKLKELNQKIHRKDVEETVWEVDEDLDQALNWNEFRLMFTRNIADRSGLEPSRMFNLTQFLIYDHNNSGMVSVDKTMNMLYARYGRFRMENKLKELFGEDMIETGHEGGEITYTHYVRAVERIQMQSFWNTTKGKMLRKNSKNKGALEANES